MRYTNKLEKYNARHARAFKQKKGWANPQPHKPYNATELLRQRRGVKPRARA